MKTLTLDALRARLATRERLLTAAAENAARLEGLVEQTMREIRHREECFRGICDCPACSAEVGTIQTVAESICTCTKDACKRIEARIAERGGV